MSYTEEDMCKQDVCKTFRKKTKEEDTFMSHEEEDTCNKDVCKTFAEDSK